MTFTPAIPSILEAHADGDRVFFIAQDWKNLDFMELSDDDQSHQPVIKGDWVAWRTGFDDTGPIVVYNRRTGERTTLPVKGDYLRMGDGLLLWWTYTSPFSYLYDLQKHIAVSFDKEDDFSDTVVYISGRKVAVTSSREPKT